MESTTSTTYVPFRAVVCRVAPFIPGVKGTGLPVAMRDRTVAVLSATPARTVSALLTSDVVFNGPLGIRSWSPPV